MWSGLFTILSVLFVIIVFVVVVWALLVTAYILFIFVFCLGFKKLLMPTLMKSMKKDMQEAEHFFDKEERK